MQPLSKPIDEEAHFRIDEMERRMASVPSTEHIAGIAGGAVSVMLEEIRRELGELRAEKSEDVKADRELTRSNQELVGKIGELIEAMKAPKVRTSTVNLPSGPVTMTTKESR